MKYSNDVAMTWKMKWLNRSVATINATLQLLDIYRLSCTQRRKNNDNHQRTANAAANWVTGLDKRMCVRLCNWKHLHTHSLSSSHYPI